MSQIRIAVNGASGRMGQEVIKLATENKNFYVCATLDKKISTNHFETYTRLKDLKAKKPQVVLDFSSPKGSLEMAQWCASNKIPLLCGTTGFTPVEKKKLDNICKKIPFLWTANVSLGINALISALEVFAKEITPCDVAVEEIHHKNKKDKPSGTATLLLDAVRNIKGINVMETASLRGGEVYGQHKVYFFKEKEVITFEHQALDRQIFAKGALVVAHWLSRRKPGLYTMKDVIKGK